MKIAIVEDSGYGHRRRHSWSKTWITLCNKFQIENRIFDSESEGFLLSIISYRPDKVLWRSGHYSLETKIKDEWQRQTLDRQSNIRVIPNWNTHYFYDHKVLQTYLFQIHKIPHPKTYIFFKKDGADEFLRKTDYPIVVKADAGAGSYSTRFPNTYKEGVKQLEENFSIGLRYCMERREKNIFYVQEYVPAPGIFRIVMIGNNIGYSFYQSNKPGTKIASSQGYDSYPPTPVELLDLSAKINREMGWDYMMYDYIWKESTKQWLILELTDTCGPGHSSKRIITHYFKDGKWMNMKSNTSPPELIFNKYVLEQKEKVG